MIIYNATKKQFSEDVIGGTIAEKIAEKFYENLLYQHNNDNEFRSWENSLRCMHMVLDDKEMDDDLRVAIEYQVPLTSKRVDFLITGKNSDDKDHVIIIELKQWESATKTSREDIVNTYVGKKMRDVVHPSYQAYSYAKTISNFNETVQLGNIDLHPCAYLHNFKEEYKAELDNSLYDNIIQLAPIFFKKDALKLREFIKTFVKKPDDGSLLYKIENGRIKPSKALQDALSGMLEGNKEFFMIDEQKVVYSTVKKLIENSLKKHEKYTVIVEGGPGTGKSVVAVNLLSDLLNKGYNVNYITKNAAPRNVYFAKLRQKNYKMNYIKNLFKGSGSFIDCTNNLFDCLLVDEAHRLNAKSGMFKNMGENQIKEIIEASKVSVFFIDEDQVVTANDIGSVTEIKKWADKIGSKVIYGDDTKLLSQFRCNGSDGYIAFLDNLLEIRETANFDGFDMAYDIRIFDNPNQLREELRLKNLVNNKSRMIAGYCYEWITKSKNAVDKYDIELEEGFKAKWNFDSTSTWAIDSDSFDQIGCIHTSQGLEFDYCGVIIGKDLIFRDGKIFTDKSQRAKSDKSLWGAKSFNKEELDKIIKNTYKTLMTRGQKGCYIYCEDKQLQEHIKRILKTKK